jgi:hypothetical protein
MNHRLGRSPSSVVALSTAIAVSALLQGAACSSTVVAATEIGPSGGTVEGPNGVQAIIPSGALSRPTTIAIRVVPASSAPALSSGLILAGDVYTFEPHGLVFNAPVQIRLPRADGASTTAVLHAACAANSAGAGQCAPWDAPLGGVDLQPGFAVVSAHSFSLYATADLQGAGGSGGAGGAGATSSSSSTAASSSGGTGGACGFSSASTYTVGVAPASAALGDLNGDGKPDLAVTNGYGKGDAVSVLLNAGDGTFADAVNYTLGASYSQFVAAGDLNGDGKPDLVVASFQPNRIYVLLSAGNGTFGAPVVSVVGSQLGGLAVGDLNGDGLADVVVTDGGAVMVLLNIGNGAFAAPVVYAVGSQLGVPVIGDLDGDGRPDVVVVADTGVSVLLNVGAGALATPVAYAAGQAPVVVAVGDLNDDGKPDLAITDQGTGTVQMLLNAGGGAFSPATSIPVEQSPFSVAVGDANGDGKPDLVVSSFSDSTVRVLLNAGGGVFTPGDVVAVGPAPEALLIADLNGDGRLDLALTAAMADTVSVLLQCQ